MRTLLFAAITFLSSVGVAVSADQPNFSGEWHLNLDKSDYGTIPRPDSLTRKITLQDASLTITDQQVGGYGGDSTSTRQLTIDGQPHTFQSKGHQVQANVKWDGKDIHTITSVNDVQVTYDDTMALSADGKQLTSTVDITSPQGEIVITLVFDRA